MEARMLVGLMASLAGFGCLFAATLSLGMEMRKRWSSLATQGDEPTIRALALWRLRNGFPLLMGLASKLLKWEKAANVMDGLTLFCEGRNLATSPRPLLTVLIAGVFIAAGASFAATGSMVGTIAVPLCLIAVLSAVAGNQLDKHQESVREAVPSALESMSACFGTGFTLLQTFRQVAEDVPGPLGATFARSAHILEMGGSAQVALEELREGAYASELAFVAVALDVHHQSGGAMRQVLEAATDSVKGELALRRSLRVQTAQAKLSARVVAIMPFILVAAFSLASPDFLSPFFSGPVGYGLLTLAIVMQLAGIVLVRRALSVDGVS